MVIELVLGGLALFAFFKNGDGDAQLEITSRSSRPARRCGQVADFCPYYAAPGEWTLTMPEDYAQKITEEDLAHLLAWLQTLSDVATAPSATPEP